MSKKIFKILIVVSISTILFCVFSFNTFASDTIEIRNGLKTTYEETSHPMLDTVGKNYSFKWVLSQNGGWKLNIREMNGRYIKLSNTWVKIERTLFINGQYYSIYDYYYFDYNGDMVTGWYVDTGGNKYFLITEGEDIGRMAFEWQKINGNYYYFGQNGILQQDMITSDGFYINSEGTWG